MLNIQESSIEKFDISTLKKVDFRKLYFLKGKPVIITGLFDNIPSLSSWSPNSLIERLSNKPVKVNTSRDGVFTLDPKKGGFASPPITIGFEDYIDKINRNDMSEKLYMQQVSILKDLPELKNYLEFPKYVDLKTIEEINLWVGPGGNTSPLHYDQAHNFFIQLYGVKSFWLAHPNEFYNLYPNSFLSKAQHMSKVNLNTPDINRYPKVLKAKFMRINLQAGEMLFLPSYWWHQVYSVNTTVSINIWSSILWYQRFLPGALHNMLNNIYYFIRDLPI